MMNYHQVLFNVATDASRSAVSIDICQACKTLNPTNQSLTSFIIVFHSWHLLHLWNPTCMSAGKIPWSTFLCTVILVWFLTNQAQVQHILYLFSFWLTNKLISLAADTLLAQCYLEKDLLSLIERPLSKDGVFLIHSPSRRDWATCNRKQGHTLYVK